MLGVGDVRLLDIRRGRRREMEARGRKQRQMGSETWRHVYERDLLGSDGGRGCVGGEGSARVRPALLAGGGVLDQRGELLVCGGERKGNELGSQYVQTTRVAAIQDVHSGSAAW